MATNSGEEVSRTVWVFGPESDLDQECRLHGGDHRLHVTVLGPSTSTTRTLKGGFTCDQLRDTWFRMTRGSSGVRMTRHLRPAASGTQCSLDHANFKGGLHLRPAARKWHGRPWSGRTRAPMASTWIKNVVLEVIIDRM